MELHYGIKQPLRFYEKLEHQNRFVPGGSVKVFNLLMPASRLLPFQLRRDFSPLPITGLKAVPTNGSPAIEILDRVASDEFKIYPFASYDQILHYGQQDLSENLPEGEYYLELTDNVNTWYSEVVKVRDFDPDDLTVLSCVKSKITYWDTCDIADSYYRAPTQFKYVMYLDIDVGQPEYEYTEEGDEDGDGNFSADIKRLEKQYLLQGVFPQYLVDALATLPLHVGKTGVVQVLTQRGYTGQVDRISISPKWQGDDKAFALTDIIFSTEFVVKTNCCDHLEIPVIKCIKESFPIVATVTEGSPDYINKEYTDASDGTTKIPFEYGDDVMVLPVGGGYLLQQFLSGYYAASPHTFDPGDVIEDQNLLDSIYLLPQVYYYWSGTAWATSPMLQSDVPATGDDRTITAVTFKGTYTEIVNVGAFGEQVAAVVTTEQLIAGYTYTPVEDSTGVFLRTFGLNATTECALGVSSTFNYPPPGAVGVGVQVVGTSNVIG